MVAEAAGRGDFNSMKQAHKYVVQQALGSVFAALANAQLAIEMHNSVSAAQYLAKANAFFSVGRIGRFGYDSVGNIWGQAVDAAAPPRAINKPFQITAEMVGSLIFVERMGNGI